jgi:[acyl-carrier-protein] S-malonyltransferase
MAGHSFGEYSALVCAGALAFDDAVKLVADRGRFMQEAVVAGEGAMAAILGLDQAALEGICEQVTEQTGLCACANLNAPGQIVIAGSKAGVDTAIELARAAGAKRALPLAVSAPAHCALMQPAAERLAERLADLEILQPKIPILHNVDVASQTSIDAIRGVLVRQMTSPVRWLETIEKFAAEDVSHIVECGPGKVLTGLNKRIDKTMNCTAIVNGESLTKILSEMNQ